jgi:CheY-like chemotaxis protein/anti-sigma regulatory factor (Ser/Thr protein kinase)
MTEVLAPLRILAAERGVALRTRPNIKRIMVRSDRCLLARVLSNLIGNAIKYSDRSKPKPAVLVGAVSLPNRVRLDIVDNGVGIPSEHWANVFEPFFQLRNGPRDRKKGLGLGLSIVKAIMQLLTEHRIEMRSAEGRGTRFSLDVPHAEEGRTFSTPQIQQPAPILRELEGLYVMYIEEDALVRASTKALFDAYGILYEAVGSMPELKETLRRLERLPDLIITDQHVRGGWTAKKIINVISASIDARVPVIVMTGDTTVSSTDCGHAPLLTKPVAPETLLAAIAASRQRQSEMA